MIACNWFFFGVFLASTATTAIGSSSNQVMREGKHDETGGALRGGRFGDRKKSIIPTNPSDLQGDKIEYIRTLPFGGEPRAETNYQAADNGIVKHVMIACNEGENEFSCKDRIIDAIPKDAIDRVRFINHLKLLNVLAAEVRGDASILDGLEGVVDDSPRETMHIKDSLRLHRSLQGQNIPYGIQMVKAMDVWETYKTKGENVRVCVIDTGVNSAHPDLDANSLFGYDGSDLVQPWYRDTSGHGTHVTGTIVASDNDVGVVGVAPGADIFTARIFSANGSFFSSGTIAALQVCLDGGAQVISMSLGGPNYVAYEEQAYIDLYEKFGIITVAAAGNSGGHDLIYPAAYNNVISVASVNENGDRSSFSTQNDKVDVAAPGSNIMSTYGSGGYGSMDGTSMACPHVTGIVALMLSVNPNATPSQIFSALESSSENPNTTGKDYDIGYGIVNAPAAVEAISKFSNSGNGDGISGDGNASGCVELVITLHTDRYAKDISHWLQVGTVFLFYMNDLDSFQTYEVKECIDPTVCSAYNIRDAFGDGINGEGVEIKYGGQLVYSGGDFGSGGVKYLGSC
uniref:subtilisin n=1 Tax=Pseudo-nitzschia australis TaxID=44445 RepID=A0A7S4AFT3_9STRA|mmetsp:Transcript_7385/g.15823  ORF Transcript_7385/g.15823 Transcript_7385/m.15823 type:complete len:571 (+) Transcript_7385:268-1980(+)